MPKFLKAMTAWTPAWLRRLFQPRSNALSEHEEREYELYCRHLRELCGRLAMLMPTLQYEDVFFELFGCYPDEAEILEIGRGRIRDGNATLAGLVAALDGCWHAVDTEER